jgi:uncharacterized protein (DUF302 family)
VLYTKEANGSFAETLDRLAQAVTDHQFGVIETIDLRAKLNAKGVEFDRPCTVFEVCNPHRAKQVLDEDIALSTALPCRISVYEQDGQVFVAMVRPSAILGLFDLSNEVGQVASEVEEDLIAIIDQACALTAV